MNGWMDIGTLLHTHTHMLSYPPATTQTSKGVLPKCPGAPDTPTQRSDEAQRLRILRSQNRDTQKWQDPDNKKREREGGQKERRERERDPEKREKR